MGRTLTEIYNQAREVRDGKMQQSVLANKTLSTSKMSVMDLMTFVMATLIYCYETILDVFKNDINKILEKKINGTAPYYAEMAKLFQYDSVNERGDDMIFDSEEMTTKYVTTDASHRIITYSAYQHYNNGYDITLKVAKDATATTEDTDALLQPLSTKELTAFKTYIDYIKFIGTSIECISLQGDLVTIQATVYYDDIYINAQQALQNIKTALSAFIRNMSYNETIYYQSVIDAIQDAEHIVSITSAAVVYIAQWNSDTNGYEQPKMLTDRTTAKSGYLTFVNCNTGLSTINEDNITLIKNSTY